MVNSNSSQDSDAIGEGPSSSLDSSSQVVQGDGESEEGSILKETAAARKRLSEEKRQASIAAAAASADGARKRESEEKRQSSIAAATEGKAAASSAAEAPVAWAIPFPTPSLQSEVPEPKPEPEHAGHDKDNFESISNSNNEWHDPLTDEALKTSNPLVAENTSATYALAVDLSKEKYPNSSAEPSAIAYKYSSFHLSNDVQNDLTMSHSNLMIPPSLPDTNSNNNYQSAVSVEEDLMIPLNFQNSTESQRGQRRPWLDCTKKKVRRRWIYAILVTAIVLLSLILSSLKRVSNIQYGVQYDVWRKQLATSITMGGLYFGPIGYKFIKFPSTQQSAEVKDTCISRDGLRVDFHVTYQYEFEKESILEATLKYRNFENWKRVIYAAGNGAIQHSCSIWNITDFQTERSSVRDTMLANLQMKLLGDDATLTKENTTVSPSITSHWLFARATSLQLNYLGLPKKYLDAVEDKQRAEENISFVKNERTQSITKAETELVVAEKRAQMIMEQAYNYGNITLTYATFKANQTLYKFDKETQVLSQAKEFLDLDTNGVLSYVANKVFGDAPNIQVVLGEPAKISRKSLLAIGSP